MVSPVDPPVSLEREALLEEAERLLEAQRESAGSDTGPRRGFLVFTLDREWYAVDLANVRKVLRPVPVSRVPGAAAEVQGLMNCMGEVMCLLDLRMILGMSPGASVEEGRLVVVLQAGGREAGVQVDTVEDVWEMSASEIAPTLESMDPGKAKLLEGTIARDGRFVGLLSAPMCLNP